MSPVHPVAVPSAVFCMFCNWFVSLFDMMGDLLVLAYSSMGHVMVLKVFKKVPLVFSQGFVVSAFKIFNKFLSPIHYPS